MGLNYGVSDKKFKKILDEVITEELLYTKFKEYGFIPDFEFNLYESEHYKDVHISDREKLIISYSNFYSNWEIKLRSFDKQNSYENNYESEDNFEIKRFFSEKINFKKHIENDYIFQGVY